MAEQEEVVTLESAAPPEVQTQAEELGWIPPTRYKGDPEKFVDAEEFIKRGETVLPIVKKQNKELRGELDTLRRQSAEQAAALRAAQETLEQIELRHAVDKQKAVETARAELRQQLITASREGDHERIAEITDELAQLPAKAEVVAPVKRAAPQPVIDPELQAWVADNPWYNVDRRKTALALGIAEELRANGETVRGRAFYDLVAAEVEKTFQPARQERVSKVDTSINTNGSSGVRGRSFESLPAEARAACDADARQFVGENKRYKTKDAWRKAYAELYFGMEAA